MSEQQSPQTPAKTEPEDVEIDIDAVTARLDKHMQRLPWAVSRLDNSPMAIQNFLRDWLVPILSDMHTATQASMSFTSQVEAQSLEVFDVAKRTLFTAQYTLQGESLSLLYMYFTRLHSALIEKLPATDPTSFVLAEMYEVFSRLGYAPAAKSPAEDAVEPDVSGSADSEAAS